MFKEKIKSKKITDTKYPVNLGYYEKTKLKNSVEMEKNSSSKVQKIFSTKSEKKFPNLKKDIHIKIQKSYRIPNILDKQRKSPNYVIIKMLNVQKKRKNVESLKGKKEIMYNAGVTIVI